LVEEKLRAFLIDGRRHFGEFGLSFPVFLQHIVDYKIEILGRGSHGAAAVVFQCHIAGT